ncbi:phenylacetyl-CoA ligase [Ganoderma leucocontextum]|nr:phenylacetyl-CoA ligase [Ganoderma leucocontextum]
MTIFRSQGPPFVPPRDDMTLPQFILDDVNAERTRPARPTHIPCLIDSESGKAAHLEDLRTRSHALARSLKARYNIGIGSVVSLFVPNHIDYGVIIWATHRLGGVVAAHSSALTIDEFAYQLEITESSLVVAYPGNLQVALSAMKARNIPENRLLLLDGHLAPDAPFLSIESLIEEHESLAPYVEHKFKSGEAKTAIAFLCFSSGTTGNPKAVAVSHYSAMCAIIQTAMSNRIYEQYAPWKDQRYRPGDVCDGTLPSYHIYGLVINLHFMLYAGLTLVVAKAFVFEKYLQNIQRYRITHLTMVPPQAVLLCKHPLAKKYDLSSVRNCIVAAAPLSAELTAELLKVFPDAHLGQGYGMTETSCVISTFPTSQKVGVLGSVGHLAPGTIAKVVKADGGLAGVGGCGELLVQGPQLVLGYYRNPKATEEAFDNGWLRTGDEVKFDAEGNIFIVDRIKELIKVKGLQVAPSELEGYLLSDPDVADAAVIGVPDEYAGELPRAYVVLKPVVADAVKNDARLAGRVRARLYEAVASTAAKHKWLEGGVELLDAIPKNPSGKILRRVLRAEHSRRRSGGRARARL